MYPCYTPLLSISKAQREAKIAPTESVIGCIFDSTFYDLAKPNPTCIRIRPRVNSVKRSIWVTKLIGVLDCVSSECLFEAKY